VWDKWNKYCDECCRKYTHEELMEIKIYWDLPECNEAQYISADHLKRLMEYLEYNN
jgi:hypothetical protein